MPTTDTSASKPASRSSATAWAVVTALVVLTVGLLFLQAPHGGAFYWSDAPRHALLGVSQDVDLHYIAFGLGCWCLAQFWLDTQGALAFVLLMLVLPVVTFWDRQVMLEVPAFAFLVWIAVAFLMHWREGSRTGLYGGWLPCCYAKEVDVIAKRAPKDSVMLFSRYRDGAFVFNVRAREDRRDLSVLRAEKIQRSVAVRRELCVEENPMTDVQLPQLINDSGVHYVVMQPGFWIDLEVMRRFERVVAGPQFEEVAGIPTPANFNAHEDQLVIYHNRGPVGPKPAKPTIELKIINRQIMVQ